MCASGGRFLREVVYCGPPESLGLLNHLLVMGSLTGARFPTLVAIVLVVPHTRYFRDHTANIHSRQPALVLLGGKNSGWSVRLNTLYLMSRLKFV